jgi:hypothetical protein
MSGSGGATVTLSGLFAEAAGETDPVRALVRVDELDALARIDDTFEFVNDGYHYLATRLPCSWMVQREREKGCIYTPREFREMYRSGLSTGGLVTLLMAMRIEEGGRQSARLARQTAKTKADLVGQLAPV